jgi:DNA-binding NarL/FixJ family response regulator
LQLQDDERRRIARDLHDITGQQVAALVMSLDRLTHLVDCPNPEAKQTIADSHELVGKIGEEIRTLSYLLHPPLLDECGLASAVRWYAEGFQKRSGIRLDVEIGSNISRFPIDAETTLFRVVQESLTNVHRYSGSADAQIRISASSDQVQLEVIDHGKGGKVSSNYAALQGPAPLGVGIPGMRERLHQLGGRLDVEFGINGTRVVAILPIKKAAEATEDPTAVEAAVQVASQQHDDVNHSPDHDTRRRILIADDHEVMRRGVRGLIESQEEWAVCGEAVEGADAVRKFLDLRPELVILDINMPGLSGLDAAQQILRENEATKILFFTVHDSEQVIREVARIGAQGYVTKSRAGHDLVDAVRNVLDGKTFFRGLSAQAARKSAGPKPRARGEQLAAARTSSQA